MTDTAPVLADDRKLPHQNPPPLTSDIFTHSVIVKKDDFIFSIEEVFFPVYYMFY